MADDGFGEIQPEEEGGSAEPTIRSWSSDNPSLFYQIRDYMEATLEAAGWSVTSGDVSRALNLWARGYHSSNGMFPDAGAVREQSEPWVRAQRAAARSDVLPSVFSVETPEGTVYYRNELAGGPLPVPIDPASLEKQRTIDLQKEAQSGPTSPDFEVIGGRATPRQSVTDAVPVMSQDYVNSILNTAAYKQTQSGGSGRSSLAFDKAQLAEAIRDRWRTWFGEEPTDVDSLVNQYINEANVMWSSGGARKDFDTWAKNRMRQTPKYQTLYSRKPETQSEEEYRYGYVGAVNQFGLGARAGEKQIARGMSTGAAPSAFAESVGVSKDVVDMGQGSFSRRFANQLAQLGPLQRT